MQNIELIFCIFFDVFSEERGILILIKEAAWLHAGEFGTMAQSSAGRIKGARSAAARSRSREKDRNARFTRCRLCRLLSEQTTHAVRQSAAAPGGGLLAAFARPLRSATCCSGNSHAVRRAAASPLRRPASLARASASQAAPRVMRSGSHGACTSFVRFASCSPNALRCGWPAPLARRLDILLRPVRRRSSAARIAFSKNIVSLPPSKRKIFKLRKI